MRRGGDRYERHDGYRRSRSRSRERANRREDRDDRRWKHDKHQTGYNRPGKLGYRPLYSPKCI